MIGPPARGGSSLDPGAAHYPPAVPAPPTRPGPRPVAGPDAGPDPRTVALAGAGHIAVTHAAAAAAAGLDVRWVASRSAGRARRLAAEIGATACTYGDLPGDAALVIVATPPPSHAALTLAAVRGGATVLVEKALAATLADADRLVDAERAGGRIRYGENLLVAPVFATALDHAAAIGPVRVATASLLMPRPGWGDQLDGSWGGGALFDVGAHPLALVLAAMGPGDAPVAVTARLEQEPDAPVDARGELELTFASGARGVVVASWNHDTRVRDLHLTGDDGTLHAQLAPDRSLEVRGAPVLLGDAPADPFAFRLHEFGFVAQLREVRHADHAATATRTPAGARLDAAFGRQVLDVLCGAYASAGAGGAAVALPFRGPRDRTPLALWHAG